MKRGIKDTKKKIIKIFVNYNKKFQIKFIKIDKVDQCARNFGVCKNVFEILSNNCNLFYI